MKFVQRDIITSTITRHLEHVGSNNFGEYTSFSPFSLVYTAYHVIMQVIFFDISFTVVNDNSFIFVHILAHRYANTLQF